jgi:hypothetical protein
VERVNARPAPRASIPAQRPTTSPRSSRKHPQPDNPRRRPAPRASTLSPAAHDTASLVPQASSAGQPTASPRSSRKHPQPSGSGDDRPSVGAPKPHTRHPTSAPRTIRHRNAQCAMRRATPLTPSPRVSPLVSDSTPANRGKNACRSVLCARRLRCLHISEKCLRLFA